MKNFDIKKKDRTQAEINKRYFVESCVFAIFFALLTLITFNFAALVFTMFCVISAFIFWKRNNS